MNILVVGAGSIGERHTRAFRQIEGVQVAIVDVRVDRAQEVAERYGCLGWYADLAAAPLQEFDGAVIATSANLHIPLGRQCAEAGLHLLMEKPLATGLAGAGELIELCRQKGLVLAVGYTLRFHPVLLKVKELLGKGAAGRLLSLQLSCAHHLPISRPDYRSIYYGAPGMGGGAILDLSHEINYAEWLLGPLRLECSRCAAVPELGLAGEAIADLLLTSEDGVPVNIHLHMADRRVRRQCYIAGSEASIAGDFIAGEVVLQQAPDRLERFECKSERDSWHRSEALDFLEAVRTRSRPRCTGEEALQTLRLCLEAMQKGIPQPSLSPRSPS